MMPSEQAPRWRQFRLRDLIAATLIVGLVMAWWVEHSKREELAKTFADMAPWPWVQIYNPGVDEKFDVGIGTFTVSGEVFLPQGVSPSINMTVELLRDQEVLTRSPCELTRTHPRMLHYSGAVQLPGVVPPGKYFLNIRIVDTRSNALLANQCRAIEFVDVRGLRRERP